MKNNSDPLFVGFMLQMTICVELAKHGNVHFIMHIKLPPSNLLHSSCDENKVVGSNRVRCEVCASVF